MWDRIEADIGKSLKAISISVMERYGSGIMRIVRFVRNMEISILFERDIKTIGKHINNVLKEELNSVSVIANFATTAADLSV